MIVTKTTPGAMAVPGGALLESGPNELPPEHVEKLRADPFLARYWDHGVLVASYDPKSLVLTIGGEKIEGFVGEDIKVEAPQPPRQQHHGKRR